MNASTATVPVAVHGFTWTAALMAVANILLGGIGVAVIRNLPVFRKLANEREANLLTERASEMAKMREAYERLEARLNIKDAVHEAERAYDRHRINNLATTLNAFFMMVRAHPDDAGTAAQMMKEERERQVEEERREAIALHQLVADLTTEKGKPE
jgi:hypothetical protein